MISIGTKVFLVQKIKVQITHNITGKWPFSAIFLHFPAILWIFDPKKQQNKFFPIYSTHKNKRKNVWNEGLNVKIDGDRLFWIYFTLENFDFRIFRDFRPITFLSSIETIDSPHKNNRKNVCKGGLNVKIDEDTLI